jgi:hypothetical protein
MLQGEWRSSVLNPDTPEPSVPYPWIPQFPPGSAKIWQYWRQMTQQKMEGLLFWW